MKLMFPGLLLAAALLLPLFPSRAAAAPQGAIAAEKDSSVVWIQTELGRMKTRIYRSADADSAPVLVVVLHGDAPFNKPGYQYEFAQKAADAATRPVTVAALLRPGYTDPENDTSGGVRGETTGDNYTPEIIEAVADAVSSLKERSGAEHVVMVGHSGGAAIVGDLMGVHPGLAEKALMLSCPCDLDPWREHMKTVYPSPLWDKPVQSLSPTQMAPKVSDSATIWLVTGEKDETAPLRFAQAYADAASETGADVDVRELPGRDHEILLDPEILTILDELIAAES